MQLTINDIIRHIRERQAAIGITTFEGASPAAIERFEKAKGLKLPDDFKAFYAFSNGVESAEDMFRIIPLDEIVENARDRYLLQPEDFHFAEYMIYCDMWTLSADQTDPQSYVIYNKTEKAVNLTHSFPRFMEVFLTGGVFDGLYVWRESLIAAGR